MGRRRPHSGWQLAVLAGLGLATARGAELPRPAIAVGDADTIVVTGIRPRPLASMPKSVTVIDAGDIAVSPATGLAELLAQEANLNLRSVAGNDKFAGVDIRGMGDTWTSNVLVLVDGVRLNPPDLAGPDLASVSLQQIERIEIVRGANAVRYGGGAVGGVVNIITRAPPPGPRLGGRAAAGSYDTVEAAVAAGTGRDDGRPWSAGVELAWSDSDGYRDNGALERTDLQFKGSLQATPQVVLDGSVQLHGDDYGLPGPVSAEDFAGSDADRRSTDRPDDGGETRDWRYRAGAVVAVAPGHELRLTVALRDRTNEYVLGYTPLLPRDAQLDEIDEDTVGVDLTYDWPLELGAGRQELTLGAAWGSTDYRRQDDGTGQVGRSRALLGDLQAAGVFVAATWFVNPRWQVSAGQRWSGTRYAEASRALVEVCDYETVPGIPIPVPVNCRPEQVATAGRDERWQDTATDTGVVLTLGPAAQVFAGYSRAFRVPNVDELARGTPDLKPQTSRHLEAGLRLNPGEAWDASVAVFRMRAEDEILYGEDPLTGEVLNRNAPGTTTRTGGEVQVRWKLGLPLDVTGTAGYTRARLASGAAVPLVPEWTAALGLRWRPRPALSGSATGRYVGSRADGNDFSGDRYPRLDAYVTADLQVTWQPGRLAWTAGVENLFDEVAAAAAYSSAVYPLPGRRFHAGVSRLF